MMQAQHTQALQKQLDQLSAEVAAQRLALAAATSERDGARAAAAETSERLRVSHPGSRDHMWLCWPWIPLTCARCGPRKAFPGGQEQWMAVLADGSQSCTV